MKPVVVRRTVLAAFVLLLPVGALAHSGGALDQSGCHADHREGNYHCHQGNLKGYSFRSRDAMKEAVRSGRLPEKPAAREGFFAKLWPFGGDKNEESAASSEPAAAENAPAADGTAAPAAASATPTGRSFEERLRILSGLRDMGLISQQEYDTRRKAILEQL